MATAELAALALRGDSEAFEQIVHEFDGALRAFTHRVLGAAWTEDVLQETYLRAFRSLATFSPARGSLRNWLYRIAYRCCLDELRRSTRRRRHQTLAQFEDAGPIASDPTAVDRQEISAALEALSAEERSCVVLVDALGFDYAAAAEVLGVPRGTVASRLNRARPLLREAMQHRVPTTGSDERG